MARGALRTAFKDRLVVWAQDKLSSVEKTKKLNLCKKTTLDTSITAIFCSIFISFEEKHDVDTVATATLIKTVFWTPCIYNYKKRIKPVVAKSHIT